LPLATAGGQIVGASQIARVITEYKRLEGDARHLVASVESSGDAIISNDLNGTITSWNRAAEQLFGYSGAEAIGQSIRLIIPADRLAEEDGMPHGVQQGEIVDHFETVRLRRDGTPVQISLTVSPIRSATGEITGISKIVRDLTVTRRQEALLQAGAVQRAIFNSANFSSIATDAKGVIQIFNVGAERMLGYAAADVVNALTPADLSDPRELIVRAQALSVELSTPITPGFEALVFKAARGIEDHLHADLCSKGWCPAPGDRVGHGSARRGRRRHRLSADRHGQYGAGAGRGAVAAARCRPEGGCQRDGHNRSIRRY
jgi:PAS domain S-box-containing protein